MKVLIGKSYHYGGNSFQFEKEFELPFTPFIGLQIYERLPDGSELVTDCSTNDYQETFIWWDDDKKAVEVSIRNMYKYPIRPECIDEEFDVHKAAGWKDESLCDIPALKSLMERDYERTKKGYTA